MIKVYSENIQNELFNRIKYYSFAANVNRYFQQNGMNIKSTDKVFLITSVTGALAQSIEYFKNYQNSTLLTRPLLLFYGLENLLYGISMLKRGKKLTVIGHGLRVDYHESNSLFESLTIRFTDKENGGINNYCSSLGENDNYCSSGEWSALEILASIFELEDDYQRVFPNQSLFDIPIKSTSEKSIFLVDQKIKISEVSNSKIIKENYFTDVNPRGRIVLKKKFNGKNQSHTSAFSQREYIPIEHKSHNDIVMPEWLPYYLESFSLSYICRYYPNIWNSFITTDKTGEQLLVSKLLDLSLRIVTNCMVNIISDQRVVISDKYEGEF